MFITFRVMEIKRNISDVPPLPARFGQAMGIASQLYAGLIARLLAPHGLTWPQFAVLVFLLRRAGPVRIADITRAVDLTQPAVTKIMHKFAGLGWVTQEADPRDQRNRPLHLTPQGRQMALAIQKSFGPAFAVLMDGWSDADAERLITDLQRLSAQLAAIACDVSRG